MKMFKRYLTLLTVISLVLLPSHAGGSFLTITYGSEVYTIPNPAPNPGPGRMAPPDPPTREFLAENPYYSACDQVGECTYLRSGARGAYVGERHQYHLSRAEDQSRNHREALKNVENELATLTSGGTPAEGVSARELNGLRNTLQEKEQNLEKTLQDLNDVTTTSLASVSEQAQVIDQNTEQKLQKLEQRVFLDTPEIQHLKDVSQAPMGTFDKFSDRLPFETDINTTEGKELRTLADRGASYRHIIETEQLSYRQQRLDLIDAADTAILAADQGVVQGDGEKYAVYREMAIGLLDAALSLTPGVGFARDCYEALTGRNLVTGEELTVFDRSMAVVGAATGGIGSKIKNVVKGIETLSDVARRMARGEEAVEKAVRAGDKAKDTYNYAKNVRSKLSNLGETIPGTTIPKYFNIEAGGKAFHVNPNATEHMGEYINHLPSSHSSPLRNDLILGSFEGAVKDAVASGAWKNSLETRKPILSGGWELIFSQNANDPLPVIIHALMKR